MRFGLSVFATDQCASPAVIATAAEAAGFDVVLFAEHTHVPVDGSSPYPGGGEIPVHYRRTLDPFVAATAALAATTTLHAGTGVCLVPAHDPIVLAKAVASIDHLSGGRFVFGVGAGWNEAEVAAHGVEPSTRWRVLAERIAVMKALWTDDVASYAGDVHRLVPSWSWPKPHQRPHPPIVVGGHGPGVLRRVVAYGDEWLAMPSPGGPPMADRMADLARLADAAGRGRPAVSVQVYGSPPPDRVVERYVSLGVDRIDLGLPHVPPAPFADALAPLAALVARFR